jgi:hypothetical protein
MAFTVASIVTLRSSQNASSFWIMLWLICRPADHGTIRLIVARQCRCLAKDSSVQQSRSVPEARLQISVRILHARAREASQAYFNLAPSRGSVSDGNSLKSAQRLVQILAPQPASPYFYETLRLRVKYAPTRRICGLKRCLRVAKPRTNARISASVSDSQFRYRVFISALCERADVGLSRGLMDLTADVHSSAACFGLQRCSVSTLPQCDLRRLFASRLILRWSCGSS